jgi:hypothetical protein
LVLVRLRFPGFCRGHSHLLAYDRAAALVIARSGATIWEYVGAFD